MALTRETDPMLRRFERNQVLATLVMAGVAAAFARFDIALAVIAGGLLMAMSYHGIRSGVGTLIGKGAKRPVLVAAKFAGRYALLALAAYVMLVSLRAHPVGVLAGAASPVVAVAVEAIHVVRAWSRHSR